MKPLVKGTLVALLCLASARSSVAASYTKILQHAVKSALGTQPTIGADDWRHFVWFTYPTSSYGVGTSYVLPRAGVAPKVTDQECAMYACLGLTPPVAPGPHSLEQFATVGTGGALTLSQSDESKVAFSVILPALASALGISGSFDKHTVSTVNIAFGHLFVRTLNKQPYRDRVKSGVADPALNKAFSDGRLCVVFVDILSEKLDVTIQLATTGSAGLTATLDALSAAGHAVGDASLSVNVSKTTSGTYALHSEAPLILAVLPYAQPAAGTLAADPEWKAWEHILVPDDPRKYPKGSSH